MDKEEVTQIINQVSNRTISTDEAIEEILRLRWKIKEVAPHKQHTA